MPPLTTHEWAAGIIDGEGCFSFKTTTKKSGRRYRYPLLSVGQASAAGQPELLLRLVELYGGSIIGPYKHPRRPKHTPQYRWAIACTLASEALPKFWPWLGGIKRAQALSVGLKEPNP